MTVGEAGRLGGNKAKERMTKLDPDYYRKIGSKGGKSTAANQPADFYQKIGRKGGKANVATNGHDHYVEIGKLGGAKIKQLVAEAKATRALDKKESA